MAKIAILTSTTPLRKTSTRNGITKQRLNIDACIQLAEQFDVVIVGSTAADQVFDYIGQQLPRAQRMKFRFYPRSFFSSQRVRQADDDGRNAGWETILAENRIEFEPIIKRFKPDRTREDIQFDWRRIADFVTDRNVVFISGVEGQLLASKPTALRGQ